MNAFELILDAVERIDIAIKGGRFTLRQLEGIQQIFERALHKTNMAIERAKEQTDGEHIEP